MVEEAVRRGIDLFYIKTDSALRGNVGAAICAAMQAAKAKAAIFAPAYPAMKRTTVHGVQLIDGIPLCNSVFSQDPFDPVHEKNVQELFERQAVSCKNIGREEKLP